MVLLVTFLLLMKKNEEVGKYNLQIVAALTFCEGKQKLIF